MPLPTLLTDADFSSHPFLEEDIVADPFLEEQTNEVALLDTDKLPVKANIEGEMKKGSKKEEERMEEKFLPMDGNQYNGASQKLFWQYSRLNTFIQY